LLLGEKTNELVEVFNRFLIEMRQDGGMASLTVGEVGFLAIT